MLFKPGYEKIYTYKLQVKKKVKAHREKSEEDTKKKISSHENEKEELDFQFDEDLQFPQGRHNTFTDW